MEGMRALWFFATYRITALGDSLASHKGFNQRLQSTFNSRNREPEAITWVPLGSGYFG